MDQQKRFNLLFALLAIFGVMILHDAWVKLYPSRNNSLQQVSRAS